MSLNISSRLMFLAVAFIPLLASKAEESHFRSGPVTHWTNKEQEHAIENIDSLTEQEHKFVTSLEKMRLPSVAFDNQPVLSCLHSLADECKRFDPDKRGFTIHVTPETAARIADAKMSLHLKNVPPLIALSDVALLCELTFELHDHEITVARPAK